jgi:hypothetical protein
MPSFQFLQIITSIHFSPILILNYFSVVLIEFTPLCCKKWVKIYILLTNTTKFKNLALHDCYTIPSSSTTFDIMVHSSKPKCTCVRSILLFVRSQKFYNIHNTGIFRILGAFAKLQKETISFVMFICSSVRMKHRPPLDGISWNAIFEDFSEVCRKKIMFHWNLTWTTGTLHEDISIFMIICSCILLGTRSVSDKSQRKSKHTFYFQ